MLIPSEILILSYCNVFITHANIHVNKLVDNIYYLFQIDAATFMVLEMFSVLPKGNHNSNLIFLKSFLDLLGSLSFIALI